MIDRQVYMQSVLKDLQLVKGCRSQSSTAYITRLLQFCFGRIVCSAVTGLFNPLLLFSHLY